MTGAMALAAVCALVWMIVRACRRRAAAKERAMELSRGAEIISESFELNDAAAAALEAEMMDEPET